MIGQTIATYWYHKLSSDHGLYLIRFRGMIFIEDQSNYMLPLHYSDVITSAMASQVTSLTIVYSTVYSDTDERKHQSSVSLAFVRGSHRWPLTAQRASNAENVSIWWPPFDGVIMKTIRGLVSLGLIIIGSASGLAPFGAKPLPGPLKICCQLDRREHIQISLRLKMSSLKWPQFCSGPILSKLSHATLPHPYGEWGFQCYILPNF